MKLNEAIEILKTIDTIDLRETHDVKEETFNLAIDTVLQALEKTQKRIGTVENALLENFRLCYDEHRQNEILKMRNDMLQEMLLNRISKDKIKEKIEELKSDEEKLKQDEDYVPIYQIKSKIKVLQELLKGE